MFTRQAAAERAGDHDPIADLRTAAANGSAFGRFTKDGDADDERPVPTVGVAAGDRHVELISQFLDAGVQFFGEFDALDRAEAPR